MKQREQAISLARQMTDAGITPDNVKTCSAYSNNGQELLRWAEGDDGEPIFGEWACSLCSDEKGGWLLWDDYGSRCETIVYRDGEWCVV